MSIMRTPPPNRYPIQTEVITFDKSVIADAINFEMSRNGQVFFVCDRIAKLTELKLLIETGARLPHSHRAWTDEAGGTGEDHHGIHQLRL